MSLSELRDWLASQGEEEPELLAIAMMALYTRDRLLAERAVRG